MWLVYVILAGAFFTSENLIQRFLLRQQKDSLAFAFYFSLVGALISLPFMLVDPKLPSQLAIWAIAILVGVLIVGNNLLLFRSANYIEASVTGSLMKLRLAWVFLLGLILLHDPFSWDKLFGTLLAIAAGFVLIRKYRRPNSSTGVSLVLGATFFNASVIVLSKYLLSYFNVGSLTFFASFLPPAIIIFFITPKITPRITKMFKEDGKLVIFACALGAFANLALNAALSLHDATSVVVINECFLIAVLAGEHFFLKERAQAWVKFVSVFLALAGAVLIEISH